MYLPLRIASRYFFSRQNQNHFGFLTLLSVLGILVSVAGFLVIDGILTGFGTSIEQSLIGFDSNVIVSMPPDEDTNKLTELVSNHQDVAFFWPVVDFESLLYKDKALIGALKIRGMDPDVFARQPRTRFYEYEQSESVMRFYLGEDFFSRSLVSSNQEELTLLNPLGDVGPTGEFVPLSRHIKVSGFFSTGHYDFDSQFAIADISLVKSICGLNCKSNYLIYYKKGILSSNLEALLRLKGYEFSNWRDLNKSRYAALRMERLGLIFLLTLVLLIATINTFSLISLISFKKIKENVLLWVLGLSKRGVRQVYLCYAFLLGIFGAVPAVIIALTILLYLKTHPLPLPAAYYLESLPVELSATKFFLIFLLAPCLSLLVGLWPAMKTTEYEPLEVMRRS